MGNRNFRTDIHNAKSYAGEGSEFEPLPDPSDLNRQKKRVFVGDVIVAIIIMLTVFAMLYYGHKF